ncbi:MAG: TonB-dependent receptor, partial [Pseudomonadota bacterium]
MGQIRRRLTATTILGAFIGMAALAASPGRAEAQEVPSFEIAPGPLDQALTRFGIATGITVIYDTGLAAAETSPGVSGQMAELAALETLLAGTGLAYRTTGENAVTLVEAPGDNGQDGAGDTLVVDPIIVQGELQQRSVQETQTSVAIITGEDLEQRLDPDIFTVIERTPGVTSAAGRQTFAIRGVPAFGFAAGRGNGQAVATVVDGAALSNVSAVSSQVRLSTWDLEQVEILRGPQSTQTGRNALFGVVNLESKDPSYEREFKLRGDLSRFETLGSAFALNVPLVDDTLAVRISGDLSRSDGFIDNNLIGSDETGFTENATLRGAIRFDPSDRFSATLKYSHIHDEVGETNVLGTLFDGQRTTFVDTPFFKESRIDTVTLDMEYFFTDEISLVSKTNYFQGD